MERITRKAEEIEEDLEPSHTKSEDLEVSSTENRSGHAIGILASIASEESRTLRKSFPETELSDSTEYRILKELEEEGLIKQKRDGWQLTDSGEKISQVISR